VAAHPTARGPAAALAGAAAHGVGRDPRELSPRVVDRAAARVGPARAAVGAQRAAGEARLVAAARGLSAGAAEPPWQEHPAHLARRRAASAARGVLHRGAAPRGRGERRRAPRRARRAPHPRAAAGRAEGAARRARQLPRRAPRDPSGRPSGRRPARSRSRRSPRPRRRRSRPACGCAGTSTRRGARACTTRASSRAWTSCSATSCSTPSSRGPRRRVGRAEPPPRRPSPSSREGQRWEERAAAVLSRRCADGGGRAPAQGPGGLQGHAPPLPGARALVDGLPGRRASAAASPTTWASARRCRCWRCSPRAARGSASPARPTSWCAPPRWCSTGRARGEGVHPEAPKVYVHQGARERDPATPSRSELRKAPTWWSRAIAIARRDERAARGRALGRRHHRRGAEPQEPQRAPDARGGGLDAESKPRPHRDARREPPPRPLVDLRRGGPGAAGRRRASPAPSRRRCAAATGRPWTALAPRGALPAAPHQARPGHRRRPPAPPGAGPGASSPASRPRSTRP
jgi:hypothetical protein